MKTPIVIVLEGADGTGKTTAANHLRTLLKGKVNVVPHGVPRGDPFAEYVASLLAVQEHTVFDRLHWGELVYGPLYRGGSRLSLEQFQQLDNALFNLGAVIIHLDGNADEIERRVTERGDDYVTPSDLPKIIHAYREVRNIDSDVTCFTLVDPTRDDLQQVVHHASVIATAAQRRRTRVHSS
jgi:thymidylate kinase